MALPKQRTLRLSQAQVEQLKRLSDKLQIDESNIIRLAITRLAEQEGVLLSPKR